MHKHCGNHAAVLTNYICFIFYTKDASAIRQRTCIVGVKTWIIKNIGTFHSKICWQGCPQYIQDVNWFLLSLFQINIRAFRAFRWYNTSWWTRCYWRTHGTRAVRNVTTPFLGDNPIIWSCVFHWGLCTPHLYHCKETGHWEPATCITTLTGTLASCPHYSTASLWRLHPHNAFSKRIQRWFTTILALSQEGQFHTAGHWTAQI